MGGQVLGGGVIVLVAVLLWLVYLLPSWNSRRQFDAAERNAVRLNQALRVLAETSETPKEVRLELTARTAAAQQKLARRAAAEREQAALEQHRLELEQARRARAAARALPEARRRRARRRARAVFTVTGLAAVAVAAAGAWSAAPLLLWTGGVVASACALLLHRMWRVSLRAASRPAVAEVAARAPAAVQDVALAPSPTPTWTPRDLPRPLTASTGSQASLTLDVADARASIRRAALDEAMRAEQERRRPVAIPEPAAHEERPEYARMGFVDDAEIEAHVRDLLARRAAG
ncbi:large exoprotein [Microbacterium aquimaris]|uniref:Large exoprotein n=1 Tax=Microbacterium aquimaris TaxID=459816 RepID=A0ABU5NA72_9MICO|nr:large exoprotein [Microbacterium aquimaris]MDZ8162926.1 large exoprotein [Microbacterium aquimaris]